MVNERNKASDPIFMYSNEAFANGDRVVAKRGRTA
jgi:hypothetical protein